MQPSQVVRIGLFEERTYEPSPEGPKGASKEESGAEHSRNQDVLTGDRSLHGNMILNNSGTFAGTDGRAII